MKDEIVPCRRILADAEEANIIRAEEITNINHVPVPGVDDNKKKLQKERENSDPFTFYVPGVCKLALSYEVNDRSKIKVVRRDGSPLAPMVELHVDLEEGRVTVLRNDKISLLGRLTHSILRIIFTALAAAYACGIVGTVITVFCE